MSDYFILYVSFDLNIQNFTLYPECILKDNLNLKENFQTYFFISISLLFNLVF